MILKGIEYLILFLRYSSTSHSVKMTYGFWKLIYHVVLIGMYRDAHGEIYLTTVPLCSEDTYMKKIVTYLLKFESPPETLEGFELFQVSLRCSNLSPNNTDLIDVFNRFKRFCRMRLFMRKLARIAKIRHIEEELMSKAWAPERMSRLIEAGVSFEEM